MTKKVKPDNDKTQTVIARCVSTVIARLDKGISFNMRDPPAKPEDDKKATPGNDRG